MIADQIKKKIGANSFFDFRYGGSVLCPSQEWKLAQLVSILTQRIDEFNRATQSNDVVFIEEKNAIEVLAKKFEEAKRDGRYIDLTEPTEQKSDSRDPQAEPEWNTQAHASGC